LAETPLARVGQIEEIHVIWRPFELRPEPAPLLDPNGDYIRNAWERNVLPLSREMGVTMVRPPVQPRTRLAHEAAAYARLQGREMAMAGAIFRAFFQDGRDIGQIEVLADVGLAAGLDPVGLRACLEQGELRAQVQQEERLARINLIDAVPYFIFDGRVAARGLQSEADLLRAIRRCRGDGLIKLEE
jgi:predicted DsbA family dithiol-disulfide isomerase